MSVVLSEHLPLLASAPDGIQKLRGLILELAVRGKLVPQDPNDEPASELIKRIAKERARLEAEGTIKKSKHIPPVTEDEQPFILSNNWEWVRLGVISEKLTDGSHNPPPDVGSGIPMLSSQNVQDGWIDTCNPSRYLSEQDFVLENSRTKVAAGDVLLTIVASIGRSAVVKQEHCRFALQRSVAVFQSKLAPEFLSLQLRAPAARRYYDQHGKGTAQKGIYLGKLGEMPLAVPPLAEQHRIVAKVDELMALCDRLEAEQADAESAHARLAETLLGTLTQSTNAADLAANWQRLAGHFDTLFTTEASIDALKQTVLQLAVTGKLVINDQNENGTEWTISRLDKISAAIVDCPHSTPKWTQTGKLCVRTSQFRAGHLDLTSSRFVSELTFAERIIRLRPQVGDILYSREGGILGIACRVPAGVEICLGQRMMLIRPDSGVDSAFLELVLNSPMINDLARQKTTGGAAPRINVATVKAYPIPVPSLAEQHHIVAKVDQLLALCDRLKADLAESRTHQDRLATTLIDTALQAA